jgi:phage terminase large subunit
MPQAGTEIDIKFARKHLGLLTSAAPIKGLYGGRAGGKSYSASDALLVRAMQRKSRFLCAREYQTSIKDSVHSLIASRIEKAGLLRGFDIQRTTIYCQNGTEFIYRGLARNLQEIRSMNDIDVAWIEEAEQASELSWEVLIPTILRKDPVGDTPGAQIWATWNPLDPKSATQRRLVTERRPDMWVEKVNYSDNPFLPQASERERIWMLQQDPDAYAHVWEGETRNASAATIFKGKYKVVSFETPKDARFFHGADWGFADDPSVLIRSFLGPEIDHLHNPEYAGDESCLYIDREAWALHCEVDHLPDLFRRVPTAERWPIYADSSRPETISYVARHGGFNISPADKWEGCVEDGIEHLKGFKTIYIHQDCKHMHEEARLYSFKVDPKTVGTTREEILPIVVDKHNHCWDAVRYSVGQFIQRRG